MNKERRGPNPAASTRLAATARKRQCHCSRVARRSEGTRLCRAVATVHTRTARGSRDTIPAKLAVHVEERVREEQTSTRQAERERDGGVQPGSRAPWATEGNEAARAKHLDNGRRRQKGKLRRAKGQKPQQSHAGDGNRTAQRGRECHTIELTEQLHRRPAGGKIPSCVTSTALERLSYAEMRATKRHR
jgi:hypothetical protein